MDDTFLELLGNLLLSTARNKRQADQFFQWLQGGTIDTEAMRKLWGDTGSNELSEMFRTWYGANTQVQLDQPYWQLPGEVHSHFHASLREALHAMGYIPREEHRALLEKYDKLKIHSQQQEATIKQLKMLLQGQTDMTGQFQNIMSKQGDAYQDFIRLFGTLFPAGSKSTEDSNLDEDK